jgi:hypothetical protein
LHELHIWFLRRSVTFSNCISSSCVCFLFWFHPSPIFSISNDFVFPGMLISRFCLILR